MNVAVSSAAATQPHIAKRDVVPYKRALALSLVLLAASSVLYLPIVHDPFANIDDQGYVYENLQVQGGLTWPTVKWAARTFADSNWHPLTWISHAADCQLFGIDPAGHHAMNIAYHAIDGLVLFWVLLLATGFLGRSFMVAALFALHPINVEAVAWAAERKTVLSTLFFLLALAAYRWYARRPHLGRYAVVGGLFALGLTAKPQIITLPFVLLLWDYWPLRRMFPNSRGMHHEIFQPLAPRSLTWLATEKIPLFLICAASALVTMKAQHVGHPENWPYSFWVRVGNAIVAYVRYLGKATWPSHLAIVYLHPGNSLRLWQVALAGLLLLAITIAVLAARRYRYLPVGWFWFLGTLIPTIGLVQVGRQAMADRYAYQSFLGLFILACWGVSDWVRREHFPKALLPAVCVVWLVALSVVTHHQITYWTDNLTLWKHTAAVTPNNWVADDMIAGILLNQGHVDEAMPYYWTAAGLHPNDAGSNLAIALYAQNHGDAREAIRRYKMSLVEMEDPKEQAKVYHNMGLAYSAIGDSIKANECLRTEARLRAQK